MPQFYYKGRSVNSGQSVDGYLEAIDENNAAGQLMNRGVTPLTIKEGIREGKDAKPGFGKRRPNLSDMALFSRQMYTLTKAGVPITRAINGLIQTTRNPYLVRAMRDMVENLESGRDLSNSLARHPDIFSGLFVNIIHVGEQSGHLEQSFLQIAKHLEKEKINRDRIKAATRYPKIVLAAIVIAVVVINIFVIPAFSSTFSRLGADLPLPTQVLIGSSNFFMNYWGYMIAVLMLMVLGASSYLKTKQGRFMWDRLKLKTPVLGDIILRTTLGRFTHSFAMSLRAGVPLVQALSMVSKTLDNSYIERHIAAMRSGVERGESLTKTATAAGIFTPLVLQMLAVGEETGNIDEMMDEVAEYYEGEVDYDLNFIGDAIEPILLIIIGGMVLVLALGVFLPMWEMSSVALER